MISACGQDENKKLTTKQKEVESDTYRVYEVTVQPIAEFADPGSDFVEHHCLLSSICIMRTPIWTHELVNAGGNPRQKETPKPAKGIAINSVLPLFTTYILDAIVNVILTEG